MRSLPSVVSRWSAGQASAHRRDKGSMRFRVLPVILRQDGRRSRRLRSWAVSANRSAVNAPLPGPISRSMVRSPEFQRPDDLSRHVRIDKKVLSERFFWPVHSMPIGWICRINVPLWKNIRNCFWFVNEKSLLVVREFVIPADAGIHAFIFNRYGCPLSRA